MKMIFCEKEGGIIDLNEECIKIPIYFSTKIDRESMQRAFNECLELIQNNEVEIIQGFLGGEDDKKRGNN